MVIGKRYTAAPVKRRATSSQFLCILSIWLGAGALSAWPASQTTPADQAPPKHEESRPSTTELAVTVRDSFGRPIPGLSKDDFRVTEGNRDHVIDSFSSIELPVSYGLIIDTTGSMRKLLPLAIEAGRAVVGSQKSVDRAFLIRVENATYELALKWTQDQAFLSGTIGTFTAAKGPTPLIDALFSSCEYLSSDKPSANVRDHKRAVVIVSDLMDTASRSKPDEVLKCLRKADVEVHALSFREEEPSEQKWIFRDKGDLTFRTLCRETGGIALFPVLTQSDVINAARGILQSCRSEYRIGYSNPFAVGSNPRQKTQVKLVGEAARKKYSIVTKLLETS